MVESASGCGILLTVLLFGYSVTLCNGYQSQLRQNTNYREESSLRCYDCNSEYDPRCGDPFNPYTIGIINCTDRKPPEQLLETNRDIKPRVCRKIVQRVEGKTRIIRGCGYIQDSRDDKNCVMRSGTKNIQIHYCACTKSLCNAAIDLKRPSRTIPILLALLMLTIKYSS